MSTSGSATSSTSPVAAALHLCSCFKSSISEASTWISFKSLVFCVKFDWITSFLNEISQDSLIHFGSSDQGWEDSGSETVFSGTLHPILSKRGLNRGLNLTTLATNFQFSFNFSMITSLSSPFRSENFSPNYSNGFLSSWSFEKFPISSDSDSLDSSSENTTSSEDVTADLVSLTVKITLILTKMPSSLK